MSSNAALRDGSVIAAPPLEGTTGEVPHLFGPGAGSVAPLARPELELVGGELRGSATRIIGVVEAR